MKITVDDEIADLASWGADDRFVAGACWALSRLSGIPADVLAGRVGLSGSIEPRPQNLNGGVEVLRPEGVAVLNPPVGPAVPGPPIPDLAAIPGVVVAAPPPPDEVLGYYPGLGPITKLADPPKAADMSQPPAPPSKDSMAEAFRQGQEAGNPAALPMDPETLAEVEAELAKSRQRR